MFIKFFYCFRPLPSAFGKRVKGIGSATSNSAKKRCFEYERNIILLPIDFCNEDDGIVPIPRGGKSRDLLAENSLIGKIAL